MVGWVAVMWERLHQNRERHTAHGGPACAQQMLPS